MRILGISGSNRKDGNSYLLLKEALKDIPLIEAQIIQIANLKIKPCELCFEACAQKPFECVIKDDLRALLEEMKSADGTVIACPFYFYVPSKMQAFMERTSCLDYYTEKRHGRKHSPLTGKPCALIAVSASGSSFSTTQILHHLQEFSLMLGLQPITTTTWPFIGLSAKCGLEKGAVQKEKGTIKEATEFIGSLIKDLKMKESKSTTK